MGRLISLECVHCGHKKGLAGGINPHFKPLNIRLWALRQLTKAENREIESIEKQYTVDWDAIGHTKSNKECPECKRLYSFFEIYFKYGENLEFNCHCKCTDCDVACVEWTSPASECRCEACGQIGFKQTGFRWTD